MKRLLIIIPLLACFTSAGAFEQTVRDEFEFESVSNHDGSVMWAGDWQEIGESNGPVYGNCQIGRPFFNRRLMWLNYKNRGWSRAVDLSGATTAELSFSYHRRNMVAYDEVTLSVSPDGGETWVTVDTFTGPASDDGFVDAVYRIEDYVPLSADTSIRFMTNRYMGRPNIILIDDVNIRFRDGPPPAQPEAPIVVSPMPDLNVPENSDFTILPLHPVFQDTVTPDENLIFSATSSNPSLVNVSTSNVDGTLTLTYAPDAHGSSMITVSATDDDLDNPLTTSNSFTLTIDEDTIVHDGSAQSVRDNFDSFSVNNNDGTVNWATSWQEIGERDGPSAGLCKINGDKSWANSNC